LRFPNAVHLNRGNHEDLKMNAQQGNGFRDIHCSRAWKRDGPLMYRLCRRSFLCLPLVHVIGDEVCVLHGGLPLDTGVTLAEINKINRKRDVPMPSCQNLGYPSRQKVTARRPLITRQNRRVSQGSPGEIVGKVKKTRTAEVAFEEGQVLVSIVGAPELEQEVSMVYANDKTKELQRLDRIFISLLWSDPIEMAYEGEEPEDPGPNTTRGMGTRFDAHVTDQFLQKNGLQCLIRSHQKHGDGYETEYKRGNAPMAVTVFSASNYPGGAGELLQDGNLASVAVFKGDDASAGQPLVQVMKPSKAWSEPHHDLTRWSQPVIGGDTLSAMKEASPTKTKPPASGSKEGPTSESKRARAQALEQLWLRIYCCRPELMAFFSDVDKEDKGTVTLAQWASAMRGCLIPDESFPWEDLAPHLASFQDGKCHYMAFLMRYKNVLSSRLESHWCRRALGQLFGKMGEGSEVDRSWKQLDRNADGELSYFELRPLLKENLEFAAKDIESDGIYTLLAALDKNCSGFVEKSEFMEAIGSGREWYENSARADQATQEENAAIDQCWGFLHSAMRTLASKHTSVSTLFRFLDTSRDGVLSRDEFMSGLKVLLNEDKQLTGSLSNWEPLLWTLIDRDGSGTVSLEELKSALYVVDSLH
jgi:Ca2+-binding EF-hand superfamily protein/diadenosine tetraphosphatase ApaH/serine/threonine PP2A family protein phosphatase